MHVLIRAVAFAAAIAAPLAAAPDDPEAKLAKLLAGRTAGPPVQCIPLRPGDDSTKIDRLAMVYHSGGTLYVNRFAGGCPELRDDTIVVTRTPGTQLCRGDIAELVTRPPSVPAGSCAFGDFTPYRRAR